MTAAEADGDDFHMLENVLWLIHESPPNTVAGRWQLTERKPTNRIRQANSHK